MGLFDRIFGRSASAPDVPAAPGAPVRREPPNTIRIANLQGIGCRENQEDSFGIVNAADVTEMSRRGLFAVVADGMGGMEDGKVASELAVEGFLELFRSMPEDAEISRYLMEGTHAVSQHIFNQCAGRSGTTLVAVHILGDALNWISVGDSAIFLGRNGGVFQVNREHTCLNDLYLDALEEDIIDRARAEEDPDGRRLTAFLGIDELKMIDRSRQPLHLLPGDRLLLCSDGISGILTPPELLETMALEPEEGCRLLETFVAEKALPQQDNYTAIMIAYK